MNLHTLGWVGWLWLSAVLGSWGTAAYSIVRIRGGLDPQCLAMIRARIQADRQAGRRRRHELLFAPGRYFTAAGESHRRRFWIAAALFLALLALFPFAARLDRIVGR